MTHKLGNSVFSEFVPNIASSFVDDKWDVNVKTQIFHCRKKMYRHHKRLFLFLNNALLMWRVLVIFYIFEIFKSVILFPSHFHLTSKPSVFPVHDVDELLLSLSILLFFFIYKSCNSLDWSFNNTLYASYKHTRGNIAFGGFCFIGGFFIILDYTIKSTINLI